MTSTDRKLPPDPRTIADMIPVRQAEVAARNVRPRCHIKSHGVMLPRPLETQTYEQMWCGVWYDCQAFNGTHRCGSSASYHSRELAAYHGEPYNVDGKSFESWDGTAWVPITKDEAYAYWAERAAEQERSMAAMAKSARRQQRARKAARP